MFDAFGSSTDHRAIAHRVVGVGAIALVTLTVPSFGIPLALGAAGYGIVKMADPRKILRGRSLSPEQQHRAGLILGATLLAVATLYSATDYSLRLAHKLEHRLHHAVELAWTRGEIKPGEIFEACRGIFCARATIVQPATERTLGIAKLSGFTVHDDSLFGWRQPVSEAKASASR